MSACWDCPACGGPVTVWADKSDGVTVNFRCDNPACKAGKAPWDTPPPADVPWPRIERDVAVTPALRRRFVSRNFMCAYNFHVLYDLGGDLYAVTGAGDNCHITGRVKGATSQDTADMLAFLSEYEAPKG